MKFWLWRTGDKSLRVKEEFIRKLYMRNLISPVLGPFAFPRSIYAFSYGNADRCMTIFLEKLFSNEYANAWGTQYTREISKCLFTACMRNNGCFKNLSYRAFYVAKYK